jgi:hypothetical protein
MSTKINPEYYNFLKSKIDLAPESGFDNIDVGLINFKDGTILKPHQRDAVNWMIRGGRRALFASFGLGKTIIQLIVLNAINNHVGGKSLIVCPLGVRQEFTKDAKMKLGIDIEYVRNMAEIKASKSKILITNYERIRDGDIDPTYFTATTLDEASVLRGYGTKTFQTFLVKFKGVKFKFVATATPAPNKYKELIHYAGYLEVMDTGQALTRFFKRDSTKANKLTLHENRESEFWLWLSSWALFISKPSDLGYDDTGYDLPKLNIIEHEIPVDHTKAGYDRDGQGRLIKEATYSLADTSKEKTQSVKSRCTKALEIITANPDDNFILWHTRESERRELEKIIPGIKTVYGKQNLDIREKTIIDFSEGRVKYLGTKMSISGSGCNFQHHCHNAIFVGIEYKFNDFIQAVHRIYRFMQTKVVNIHIIFTESERGILDELKRKWKDHNMMVEKMIAIIKRYGLSATAKEKQLTRSMFEKRVEAKGDLFTAVNNDTILELENVEDNTFDEIITSIPFGNHYEYTANYNDLGHNPGNERFFEQMDFLSPHLLRTLKPGRVFACHVKDRVLFGNATGTGMPTMDPFHMFTTLHYIKHGFQYFGMITVVTDVVRENNQTYRLGYTQKGKDGTKMGVGCPEYILLFRKLPTDTSTAFADVPVEKTVLEYTLGKWQIDAHANWRSSGDRLLTYEDFKQLPIDQIQKDYRKFSRETVYEYLKHVELADILDKKERLPKTFMALAVGSHNPAVWDDVNRMLTLNMAQKTRDQEKHICPLQFDIVDRLIEEFSNKGDLIFDPFAGLGTVSYRAIMAGRRGFGCELNPISWHDSLRYLKAAEDEVTAPTLFDFEEME